MAGQFGQLVRLTDGSSVNVETLVTGSVIAGVELPGLGLNEQDYRNWSSTDISSTTLGTADVRFQLTDTGSTVIEFNGGNLSVDQHPKNINQRYKWFLLLYSRKYG